MKVGILTFHNMPNYGAVYQALGLQQALIELGHEPIFLNYTPPYVKKRVSFFKGWGLSTMRINKKNIIDRFKEEKRRYEFVKFKKKNLIISKALRTKHSLSKFSEKLDAIIVGSDQVWNMNWMEEFDDTYFLGWLDKKKNPIRTISYGACFGTVSQPLSHLNRAFSLMKNFDFIGLRNEIHKEAIQSQHCNVFSIVDPAFFLKKDTQNDEHVFLYFVDASPAKECLEVCVKISKVIKSCVIHVQSEAYLDHGEALVESRSQVGPDEWRKLLTSAKFVVSESFHGVVFSLLHNIPFLCIASEKRSERIKYLVERYSMEERLISKSDVGKLDLSALLNMQQSNKLLDDIDTAKNFLARALS